MFFIIFYFILQGKWCQNQLFSRTMVLDMFQKTLYHKTIWIEIISTVHTSTCDLALSKHFQVLDFAKIELMWWRYLLEWHFVPIHSYERWGSSCFCHHVGVNFSTLWFVFNLVSSWFFVKNALKYWQYTIYHGKSFLFIYFNVIVIQCVFHSLNIGVHTNW